MPIGPRSRHELDLGPESERENPERDECPGEIAEVVPHVLSERLLEHFVASIEWWTVRAPTWRGILLLELAGKPGLRSRS